MDKVKLMKLAADNVAFKDCCEILAVQGAMITFAEPAVKVEGKAWHISWAVKPDRVKDLPEFARVAIEFDGSTIITYFDELNCKYFNPIENQDQLAKQAWPPKWWPFPNLTSAICWSWSQWQTISVSCESNFFCFFKSQRATYLTQTRYCIQNPNKIQTKKWKVHCGC